MHIIQEPLPEYMLKKGGLLFPASPDIIDDRREVQPRQRIAVVEPGMKYASHQGDPVGVRPAMDFLALKFDLVEGAFDQIPLKPCFHESRQGLQNQGFDRRRPVGFRPPEADNEGQLAEILLQTRHGRKIFTQT